MNGKYKAKNALGKLVHDFNCTDADDMNYEPLAKGVRHFKETPEGRREMCESFEKLADKRADERQIKTRSDDVLSLMNNLKLTLEQALNALSIQGKERAIIAKQLQK